MYKFSGNINSTKRFFKNEIGNKTIFTQLKRGDAIKFNLMENKYKNDKNETKHELCPINIIYDTTFPNMPLHNDSQVNNNNVMDILDLEILHEEDLNQYLQYFLLVVVVYFVVVIVELLIVVVFELVVGFVLFFVDV